MLRKSLVALTVTTTLIAAAPVFAADNPAPSDQDAARARVVVNHLAPPSDLSDHALAVESLQVQKDILTALNALNATLAASSAPQSPSKQFYASIETELRGIMRAVRDPVDVNATKTARSDTGIAQAFAQAIAKANADAKKAFDDAILDYRMGSRTGLVKAANIVASHKNDADMDDWRSERQALGLACRWPTYDPEGFSTKYPAAKSGNDTATTADVVTACKNARLF